MINLKDNSKKTIKDISEEDINNIKNIQNRKIKNIIDNDEVLIFSNNKNDINEQNIFNIQDDMIYTNNIIGFIGYNNTQIKISSRFASNNKDYFLHYMLMKVLDINIFNLKHNIENDNALDFLIYLFFHFFKNALRQGLYKKYKLKKYNDSNIKGIIDINRHIRNNIPFNGKIAYNTREYSYDNDITQLIRHTIEYIKSSKYGNNILIFDNEIKIYIQQIYDAAKTYDKNKRQSIINKNLKKLSHPYYYEYEPLRKICIQILRNEKLKYGNNDNKIYGILFDGAWLWEEYLSKILKDFTHSNNKNSNNKKPSYGINLLNNKWKVYPDFYKINDNKKVVLDAKYKRLNNNDNNENIQAHDKHQIISYAYTLQANMAGFIYPLESTYFKYYDEYIGSLNKQFENNLECSIYKFALNIPNEDFENINDFANKIQDAEKELYKKINNN